MSGDCSRYVFDESTILALRSAAESCEGDTMARMGRDNGAACDALASAVSAATDIVSDAIRDARLRAKRQCASRDKRLEWRFEELDGCSDMLESFERQLCVNSDDVYLSWLEESLATAGQLLDEVDPLPCCSSLIFAGDIVSVLSAVADMSHVQEGIDVGYSTVSHPPWLRRGECNRITISCRDAFGDAVRVKAEDVHVSFGAPVQGWTVGLTAVQGETVNLSVVPATQTSVLVVNIGCTCMEIPLQAGVSLVGKFIRMVVVHDESGNAGLAVSQGGVMVVSNRTSNTITVYRDGRRQAEIGGVGTNRGRFRSPSKLCFSPRDSNNVFITDGCNRRVQEITLAGAHVKTIGYGVIDADVYGIAARTDMLAVATASAVHQILLFDMPSGARIGSFGVKGEAEGQLSGSCGLRFTPDRDHILIAENFNSRVSLFTLTGSFVRCIGVGMLKWATDVELSPTGDILVADNHRVAVFSPDGSTLLRVFGKQGTRPGEFKGIAALAMHGDALYVLDGSSRSVQSFR